MRSIVLVMDMDIARLLLGTGKGKGREVGRGLMTGVNKADE